MKLKTQLFSGYSILFVLMIIIGIIAFQGLENADKTSYWVTHTHEAISKARLIEKSLIDMETGLRGFVIVGEEKFLEPYNSGELVYKETFDNLRNQVADNPAQQVQLDKVDLLTNRWKKSIAQPAINLRKQVVKGAIDADYLQEVLGKGTGKNILDNMRQIMDNMIQDFRIDGNVKGEALTEAIAKSMVDQETGQRGFLITGKEEFLEPYISGQKNLKKNLDNLRKIISNAHDRIGTINDLNELLKLADKWHQEAGQYEINLRHQVNKGALKYSDLEKVVDKAKGKQILDKMRVIMDRMDKMFVKAENDKADALIIKIAKSMVDQETGQRGFLITGKEEFLEPYIDGKKSFKEAVESLQKLNKNAYDIPRMINNVAKLEGLASEWQKKAAEPEISARREMNKTEIRFKDVQSFIGLGKGKELMDNLRVEIKAFINVEKSLLATREKDSHERTALNEYSIIGGTVLAIIIGIFTMILITKSLIQQVGGEPGEIAKITQNLASGDIQSAMNLRNTTENETGIYASVIQIVNIFKKKHEESLEQNWLKSGQNEINSILSSELDVLTLTDKAVHFVAEHIQALLGAVYVMDNDTDLKLMGSYAFTRRKGQNEKIEVGEGLIGEAARTQKSICVTELPEDYTAIKSSTGKTLPKNLIVVPLIFEGKTKGVMELGTLETIKDIELEFVETIAKNIALAINSSETRLQVDHALEKSQSLAEELQVQQEELKVTNEELTEQTEALKESEERLTVQSEELRVANEDLIEKTEALNIQKKTVEDRNQAIEAASQELEQRAKDLEIASKYKSEFLANMSHELRTPLNSLLILSESLSENDEGNLTEEQIESLQIINSGGKDLLALINDILDLSKVEAGKLDVYLDKTPVAPILQSMKRQFQHVADNKSLKFEIDHDESLNYIFADKKRVEQIIKNLLSNAFKFTSEGSVTLKVAKPDPEYDFQNNHLNNSNCLAMSVIDTGIGIAEEKQKSIFEAFQQADGSTNRKYGGTGLGLTITRELSRLMNGEIYITSKFNEGSVFTFFIPIAKANEIAAKEEPTKEAPTSPNSASQKKTESKAIPKKEQEKLILIVEDDIAFSKVLKKVVESKGYTTLCTDSGMQALTLAKLHTPAAVLLDLGLPDIDGKQVLEQLKNNLKTRHIPVHVISGQDTTEDLLLIGAIGHLTKPVEKSEIEDILSKIEGFSEKEEKTILLVDDDEKTIFSVKKLIARDKLNILTSDTAAKAKEVILNEKLDCVILDLTLPDMSGFELLEQLTGNEVPLPPVIVYTGKELTRTEFNKLKEMAKSIVIKGAESGARLLDDVSLFLHSVEKRLPEEQKKIIEILHDKSEVLKNKKILVVDDDSRNIFAVGKLLQKNGMEVTTAENGKVAVDKVNTEEFDAVLMDIMMPVMNGYDAIKRIREMKGEALPIIAFTAKAMQEDREKCIEAGANDYITKPLDSHKLLSLLSVWLFQ